MARAIRRVGVLVKPHQPEAVKTVCRLVEFLTGRGVAVVADPRVNARAVEAETGCAVEMLEGDEQLAASVDLLVVLGGDGTMLAAARAIGDRGTPVLGVNYGTLGYLTEHRVEEMIPALEDVLGGRYRLDRRMTLSAELI
ncbi:MAG TPA: NAD(+)/NADH kinase, partial [Pyrinomonadaceae bacterium]|nr:NAD(+)/NADH kinase [Pyrinomonadaceae bacterium]